MYSDDEYKKLFHTKRKKLEWKKGISLIAYFTLLFIFFYGLFNAPAIYQRLVFVPKDIEIKTISAEPYVERNHVLAPVQKRVYISNLAVNHIAIPSLNVTAPLNWDVTEETYYQMLENGVIHLKGTAKPDQTGNVFVAGHSSNFIWAGGGYKTIFSTLPNIEDGADIIIDYNDQQYLYRVEDRKVVKPNDLSVLEQGDQAYLTLMTCVPVGTAFNRLVVRARLIEGTISEQQTNSEHNINRLPAIR